MPTIVGHARLRLFRLQCKPRPQVDQSGVWDAHPTIGHSSVLGAETATDDDRMESELHGHRGRRLRRLCCAARVISNTTVNRLTPTTDQAAKAARPVSLKPQSSSLFDNTRRPTVGSWFACATHPRSSEPAYRTRCLRPLCTLRRNIDGYGEAVKRIGNNPAETARRGFLAGIALDGGRGAHASRLDGPAWPA